MITFIEYFQLSINFVSKPYDNIVKKYSKYYHNVNATQLFSVILEIRI